MFPVESFQSTIGKAVKIFRQLGIRFHLTGGATSALYGEPRMTQDIDIVVDNVPLSRQLDTFLEAVATANFLFDAPALRRAVRQFSMFQLFDSDEALKIDIYPRELIAGELDRSVIVEVFVGVELPVVSRSDAAVSKLIWISKGSHKSRRDLRHIYRTSTPPDRQRIQDLALQYGLLPLLEEVLNENSEIE